MPNFDAFLLVSFGGPEKHVDVIPFLENVLRGRDVPRERLLEVAEHYYHFGGGSPINQQNRELLAALKHVLPIPVYWGNRNWHPLLAETVTQMRKDGVRRALALATSAFGSYSGCRQYIQNIADARTAASAKLGEGAPEIVKLPPFSGHPQFVEAMADRLRTAVSESPDAQVVFTAHSIPESMAATSPYVEDLKTACAKVYDSVFGNGVVINGDANGNDWTLVYQSRSGPPTQPWLGPDVCDYIRETKRNTIVAPIGFLSDHMEVLYDLDTEARAVAEGLGVKMVRAGTVGTHPAIMKMIAEMVERAQSEEPVACSANCCPAPLRRPAR